MRTRLTILSMLSAGLIIAVGSAALLFSLRLYLVHGADTGALQSAHAISVKLQRGSLSNEILPTDDITSVAQVVQRTTVVSATSNAVGDPPFVFRPQRPGHATTFGAERLRHTTGGPFRVAALGTTSPHGNVTVYVAVDTADAYKELAAATKVSGAAALIILTALGGLLWVVLGAALAPVAHITRRAAHISIDELHLRVPVPKAHDEVFALAATINSMLDRIESSVQRQDAFVADAAHELRTPLATLRTRVEVELRDPDHPEAALLETLLADVARMTTLVDQLLLLARGDAALGSTHFEPVDIDDLVVRAASEFANPTIRLTVHETTPVQISGRLTLLEQVLPNLLTNAERYARRRIDINVASSVAAVVIDVDDDGPGIPEADRDRVFERFIRLDDSRGRSTGGYGLGLAIVAQIVTMNGGRVTALESPLGGARIRVELPRTQPGSGPIGA